VHVDPDSQTLHPLNDAPPHCPYLATGVQDGVVGVDGAALVTSVVATGAALEAGTALDGAGAGALPVPSQTAGPGI
jgi:hypothetical protein